VATGSGASESGSATTVTVRAERLVAGGDALAHGPDGRVVFVHGALPGELIQVRLTASKRDWSRGDVTDVLEPATERVTPPCPHRREGCGGCDWQHLALPAQLPAKAAIVADALRRTARLAAADVVEGGAVPGDAYRTTVRVVGGPGGRAGFRSGRSHDVIPIEHCMVAHPAIFEALRGVQLDAGAEVTLRVSAATGEMTATWDPTRAAVRGLPEAVQSGPRAAIHEAVCGHRLRVSARSFFQSGPAAAELLVGAVQRVAPELQRATHAVDAYAGVGLFGVAAVPESCRVTAIESARSSERDARANLAARDATVVRAEVAAWKPHRGEIADVVIADPPRTGLGRPGVSALAAAGAPVFVLVSCDPVALARDATLLRELGYVHVSTEVLDAFPMTHHVETVTRFTRD
jgi:23S rRNA (uracil1939-C5)-methyltransferase